MGMVRVCLHSLRRFFVCQRGVRRWGGTAGRRAWEGRRRRAGGNSASDEKGEAEGARVTEEFRNDRRPVASLTDDALLRSRLQAQKDGNAVMDSKWLEIVGRCHRATSFPSLPRLSLSPFTPSSRRNSRHAMHSPSTKTDRRARATSRDSRRRFCASELPRAPRETRSKSKLLTARRAASPVIKRERYPAL